MLQKKFFIALLASTIFLAPSVFATTRPCPCEFALTGEYVALHPVIDNPFFVINNIDGNDAVQIGPRLANKMRYHSGFRVGAGYGLSNCMTDIRASWLHVHTKDSRGVSDLFLHPTTGYMDLDAQYTEGGAESNIDFEFDRVEVVLGQRVLCTCGLRLVAEAGVQFARIDNHSSVFYFDTADADFTSYKSRFCGGGPQLGLDIWYELWNCFAVVATFDGALLIGESKASSFGTNEGETSVDVDNDKIWRIIPAFNARFGLNYEFNFCWCGWNLGFNIEGGYQFITYLDALDSITWVDNIILSTSLDLFQNVSFHGPFVSLTARF